MHFRLMAGHAYTHTHTGLPNNNNNVHEYYHDNKNNTENSWKSMKSGETNNNKLILVEKLLRLFVVICSTPEIPESLDAIVLCWIWIQYTKQMSNVNFISMYVFVVRVCFFHFILSYTFILHMVCIQFIGTKSTHSTKHQGLNEI